MSALIHGEIIYYGSRGKLMNHRAGIRGVDHLGITVPDIDSATQYFVRALGAEIIYDVLTPEQTPLGGAGIEAAVGISEGTTVRAIRLLRLHDGPSLGLFEYQTPGQKASAIPSDFGLQHLAVYVDDIACSGQARGARGRAIAERSSGPAGHRGRSGKSVLVYALAVGNDD